MLKRIAQLLVRLSVLDASTLAAFPTGLVPERVAKEAVPVLADA